MLPEVREVLEQGAFCHVAALTGDAPHLTPVVFALDGDRLWLTTARSSRKNRLWRERPEAAGLVRAGALAVSFRGPVEAYDMLDPGTWARSVVRSPILARAAARFTAKNARFFAGYARDARQVPLGWTPPGRVFLSVEPASGALLDLTGREVAVRWGRMGTRLRGAPSYRRLSSRPLPDERAPGPVRDLLGESGEGALAVRTSSGTTVLPVHWSRDADEGAYYAILPRAFLKLAGGGPELPASLVVDRASRWRASQMVGVQIRGEARVFLPGRLRSGAASLARRLGPVAEEERHAVVRLRPERAVWWRGWSSGSLGRR